MQDSFQSNYQLFCFIQDLYTLAGLRPEIVEKARNYMKEAINPVPDLAIRFKDMPVPKEHLTIYQRIADGLSNGLGNHADFKIHFGENARQ